MENASTLLRWIRPSTRGAPAQRRAAAVGAGDTAGAGVGAGDAAGAGVGVVSPPQATSPAASATSTIAVTLRTLIQNSSLSAEPP
jgi:hypothetical protein